MRKLFLLLGCSFLIWSCDPKPADPQPATVDTTNHEKSGTENSLMGLGGDLEMDAVVLGAGVRSRKSADVKGDVVRKFEQGELVKVVEQGNTRDVLSEGKSCDELGYPWVKVRDSKGEESWIFGKYLYKFSQLRSEKGRVHGGQEISAGGKTYHFHLAADLSQGPGQDGELSGCDITVAPLLVETGNPKAILFYANPGKLPQKHLAVNAKLFDTNLFLLNAESEEIMDRIEDLTGDSKNPVITMTLSHYFQDTEEQSTLKARVSKDRVDVVEFESTGTF